MTSPQSYALNEAGEVIGLNLNDGNLIDADLAEVWKNTKLQALNLSNNQLAKVYIPKELNQLKYLNLSHNKQLQDVSFEAGLPSLERLEIAGCVLRQIHLPRGFHCLKALFLQKNQLPIGDLGWRIP